MVGHTLFLQNSVAFFWRGCVDFTLGEEGYPVYNGCTSKLWGTSSGGGNSLGVMAFGGFDK